MVGDIKQSIYRFRNANPTIFSNKYVEYKHGTTNDIVIDLSKNFRSREEVLNNINLIFSNIMDINYGGANYNDGHALVFGNKKYNKYKSENNNFEVYYYNPKDYDYKEYEIEAMIIASDIKNKIESGYKVLKDGKLSPVSYDDFCILTADKKQFDFFKRTFELCGIPLAIHSEEKFIDSDEIKTIINLVRLVVLYNSENYNNEYKYSLMSVLRIYLFEEDDNKINDLRDMAIHGSAIDILNYNMYISNA